jgi:hypothetical protein
LDCLGAALDATAPLATVPWSSSIFIREPSEMRHIYERFGCSRENAGRVVNKVGSCETGDGERGDSDSHRLKQSEGLRTLHI